MKQLIFILLILFNKAVFSQDLQLTCGKDTVPCSNGGKNHFELILYCPCVEFPDVSEIPQAVIDINNKYLTGRMGEDFFKTKVIFRASIIIEEDKFDEIRKKYGHISRELCNNNAKYAFEYYFAVQDSMNFYFTTVYDLNGNLLSAHQTPDIKTNKNYSSIIDICKAKEIAEQDNKFKGKLIGISLEYSSENNSFVWVVEKPEVRKGRKITNRFIVVDAQTGKITERKTSKGIIVCALPSF